MPMIVRIAWGVLAVVTAAFLIAFAVGPMYWASECQLGIFPTARISSWEQCQQSALAFYGPSLLLALGMPVVLCLVPAVFARRSVARAASAGLVLLLALSLLDWLVLGRGGSVWWHAAHASLLPALASLILLLAGARASQLVPSETASGR